MQVAEPPSIFARLPMEIVSEVQVLLRSETSWCLLFAIPLYAEYDILIMISVRLKD